MKNLNQQSKMQGLSKQSRTQSMDKKNNMQSIGNQSNIQKLVNQIMSDAVRLSKTPFFILHLVIPLLGVLIFTGYQRMTGYAPEKLTFAYYQALTLIFPLLAAWLCSVVTDQEIEAGGGFFLLNAPSRLITLFSKLLYLMLFGLLSCLLATLGYFYVFYLTKPDFSLQLTVALSSALVIWGCALFEYFFHIWLGLHFGRNISFAVAAAEILLAALMITGLGEAIWFFVPSAWSIRLVPLLSRFLNFGESAVIPSIQFASLIAIAVTLIMIILLFLWFRRWEGRTNEE